MRGSGGSWRSIRHAHSASERVGDIGPLRSVFRASRALLVAFGESAWRPPFCDSVWRREERIRGGSRSTAPSPEATAFRGLPVVVALGARLPHGRARGARVHSALRRVP